MTGAFRTSPISSILADAHELPLARRRDLLSMRYACKLRQFPEHPTYAYVFSRHILDVFKNGTAGRTVPLCVRAKGLLQEAGIMLRGIARVSHSRVPPWELVTPDINMSLANLPKNTVLPAELISRSLELISFYNDREHIYTDGSKSDTGVGCAFVYGPTTRTFTLPSQATVFTSELVAIHKALSFIEVSDDMSYTVFTDSLSSLFAMRDFNTLNPVLQDILVLLTSLDRTGKSVTLCWIPSHVGILGNERADAAAKRASQGESARFMPLPAKDLLPVCSSHVRLKWQEDWESTGSKLKAIKPRLAQWPSSMRTSRREEVQLCRLRIGHTLGLATHCHLLCGDSRPRCSRCGENFLLSTVAHVLVACPRLSFERGRFFGSTSLTLKELLADGSDHIPQVFHFLANINFPVIFSRLT